MIHPLHEKALGLARNYLRNETELIECLKQVEKEKVFALLGYSTLIKYATLSLGLSDDRAATLIQIARKSVEVPDLQVAIEKRQLCVTKARRIATVLTKENSADWIQKAIELSRNQLEKELVKDFPAKMIRTHMKPVSQDRLELKTGISEALEKKLNRVRELVAQKTSKPCSLESALDAMADEYLKRMDPMLKAERANQKSSITERTTQKSSIAGRANQKSFIAQGTTRKSPVPGRVTRITRYIPAHIRHQVYLRDKGECQACEGNGQKCGNRQWLEVHHIRPWMAGGNHDENLELRCSAHHAQVHNDTVRKFG